MPVSIATWSRSYRANTPAARRAVPNNGWLGEEEEEEEVGKEQVHSSKVPIMVLQGYEEGNDSVKSKV